MARPKTKSQMSPEELRECIETAGGFTRAASLTGASYRALQEYAHGKRGVPAGVAKKVRALRDDWRRYMTEWKKRVEAELDREYPDGIRP